MRTLFQPIHPSVSGNRPDVSVKASNVPHPGEGFQQLQHNLLSQILRLRPLLDPVQRKTENRFDIAPYRFRGFFSVLLD
ncbi:hypothetical protein D3C72_1978080 [compost metagenome]